AFCEGQGTAATIQEVAGDRRFSKAHVDVHMGGIHAAIQVYHQQKTPDILLVETSKSRDEVMAELGGLAQVCEPTTKVIVVGQVNDVILYRDLIRAGVSEYMVAPINEIQVIELIAGMYSDPEAEPVGRLTAFIGSKGGVGSSTIAHNIGWYISKTYGTDTVITDLDMAFGTAGLNFNNNGMQGIAEALKEPERIDTVLIDRLLTKCTDKLSLLLAPGTVEREVKIEAGALETVLDVVRKNVPQVVVDLPNIWAPWSKHTLEHADDIIIVATPELASLRNTKNLIDHFKNIRKNDSDPILVLNQVGMPKRPEVPVAEFAKAVGVTPTIVIDHDANTFGTANSNGQMIFEVAAKSSAAQGLAALAGKLTGHEEQVQKKTGKFSMPPLLSKLKGMGKK
ncbi:MAG TPA: CtpF protein, partial [Rhizobiales bacterium]|nr:CtpF protein [Hyphomicrobiales bacterium]